MSQVIYYYKKPQVKILLPSKTARNRHDSAVGPRSGSIIDVLLFRHSRKSYATPYYQLSAHYFRNIAINTQNRRYPDRFGQPYSATNRPNQVALSSLEEGPPLTLSAKFQKSSLFSREITAKFRNSAAESAWSRISKNKKNLFI